MNLKFNPDQQRAIAYEIRRCKVQEVTEATDQEIESWITGLVEDTVQDLIEDFEQELELYNEKQLSRKSPKGDIHITIQREGGPT